MLNIDIHVTDSIQTDQILNIQYQPKGLQHYTCVKRVYYTHITCSVHAVATHLTRKYTKMRVITRMLLHVVDMILRVKLHAVVQLELINCV